MPRRTATRGEQLILPTGENPAIPTRDRKGSSTMSASAALATEPINKTATIPLKQDLRVVICGSYKRGGTELRQVYEYFMEAGCQVLSPRSIDFVEMRDGFAYCEGEQEEAPATIEQRHLRAMSEADIVWLHAPDSYVGNSGAMELGFAQALGLPVYSDEQPKDVALRGFVQSVSGPAAALADASRPRAKPPSSGLHALQQYYSRVAVERGYDSEDVRDCMLLLTEEVGELARAIRKSLGLKRHRGYKSEDIGTELADIQLYLVHLANIVSVDLGNAVSRKEKENAARFLRSLE